MSCLKHFVISLVLLAALTATAQTNTVTDPAGNVWSSTSDMGYYWAGFGLGCSFFAFGMLLRLARGTGGSNVTEF